ncbi:MAG: lytic transglycosylase domain-containing protein [Magnetospirillum sp.]|nr:lytic transglycosylase domain-containing protein [Magnetospirillum sp.]
MQIAAAGGGETMTAALMPGVGREARVTAPPRPLSPSDADTYARVFKLEDAGQWAAAERELGRVDDDLLKGRALARRYLSPGYHPKYQDLRAWMANYADLPEAEAIYALATARGVKGFGVVKPPVRGYLKGAGIDTSDDGANWEDATVSGSAKGKAIEARMRRLLREGKTDKALSLVASAEKDGLAAIDVDRMKLALAMNRFADGREGEAAAWASQAADRSGDALPAAHWLAGLAQWRQGKPELARTHFEALADSGGESGWMVSAGAFWAARANLVSRRPEVVNHWLEVAATYPRTFYGLLARRVLGYQTLFSWETAPFTDASADMLMRVPGGRRALALLQIGRKDMAEDELRKTYPRAGKPLRQSMLALAQTADMPDLAVRLGGTAPGGTNDAVAFPVPGWNPRGGWVIDKALVLAFVRQESAFNPKARSGKGAGGLMQVMPATATLIGGKRARDHLANPEVNLDVGQRYLAKLLRENPVNGNLLFLAAAYNAGPGKLGQWLAGGTAKSDPLLFIETLPSRETRSFVQRVMTNYWVYRSRLSEPSTSLDAIAAGNWPVYDGAATARIRNASTR